MPRSPSGSSVPVSHLDHLAEASGYPDIFAEALAIAHEIGRREMDLPRVRADVDRCPQTPVGLALAREWWAAAQRRDLELTVLRRRLEALRLRAPIVVGHAEEAAPSKAGQWIIVPGGSTADGG
jgi:hypothetical protein